MIIVSNKNEENTIYFPKNLYINAENNYNIILKNRGTNVEYKFEDLSDTLDMPFDYYSFEIDFSKIPDDEYEYLIYDAKNKYGSGIIRISSLNNNNIYYNDKREYIIYENVYENV